MNKTFVSFKESLLPINQISLSDDEMLLVRGGNDGGGNDAGSGAGCGCDCYSGSGCGCHCSSGAGCGCNCSSGLVVDVVVEAVDKQEMAVKVNNICIITVDLIL